MHDKIQFGVKARFCFIFVTFCLLSLAGCKQYLERQNGVYFGAGDSIEANKALMMKDPWPKGVRDKHYHADGDRHLLAIQRYKENKTPGPSSGGGEGGGGGGESGGGEEGG